MKRRGYKQKKLSVKKKIIITTIFLSAAAFLFDIQMRPLIKSVIFNQAQTASINIINKVIVEELSRLDMDYSDILDVQKDNNGKILAISTDMKKANSLKSLLAISIQEKLSKLENQEVKVPVGTFTGTEIFNGRGPRINVRMSISGSVVMDFKSEFISAGINQTKHRLYLDVSTEIFAIIPGYPVNTVMSTSILIAETIIVGEVPKLFAGFTQ